MSTQNFECDPTIKDLISLVIEQDIHILIALELVLQKYQLTSKESNKVLADYYLLTF